MSSFKRVVRIGCVGSLGLSALLVAALGPCWSSWALDGIVVRECPAGEPRPVITVTTDGLERGRSGAIEIEGSASYFNPRWRSAETTALRRFKASAALRVGDALMPVPCKAWRSSAPGYLRCDEATLPADVPDGDHTLVVTVDTPLDEDPVVEVPLPLYVPAALHVLTDRPLYEPGQTVRFRGLSLSRDDLVPLDDRPGTWEVLDPRGRLLLEERSPGGAWGVTESSFPLAADAEVGTWTVRWSSGQDSAEATIQVRPFTLPRFSVEAHPDKPWYTQGDAPRIAGLATYASGAPASGAAVEVRWSGDARWPPPSAWLEPQLITTGADGGFSLSLPPIPADLPAIGTTAMTARYTVTDEGGEVIRGAVQVLLSRDPVRVDGVTEIGDGLVGGYSNRVYLRATTPDGRALANREITVRRGWDPRDPGERSVSDEDGVIALQLDPGEPVNLTTPPPPWRPPPPSVTRAFQPGGATQLLAARAAGVAESRAMDGLGDSLERRCAYLVTSGGALEQVIRVRGGQISQVAPAQTALQRCAAQAALGASFQGAGVYSLRWQLAAPAIPSLILEHQVGAPGPVAEALAGAAVEARRCLADRTALYQERAEETGSLATGWSIIWSTTAGSRQLRAELDDATGDLPGAGCVAASLGGLRTQEPAASDSLGVTRLGLRVPALAGPRREQPTVAPGYELSVAVAGVGETTWRAAPGAIPDLRLRPSEVITEAGEPFEVEILRGPGFSGALPESLRLMRGVDEIQVYELPDDSRVAKFTPPAEASGFLTVEWGGARALVYARPAGALSLSLSTPESVYRPGASLALQVQTSAPAVVSLVGVDSRLGQLTPLQGPGDLGEALVPASSEAPAFGRFDAVALAMGAVRGEAAARAAVLRVSALSPISSMSPVLRFSATAEYDPDQELAEVFYGLLPDVRAAVRGWEETAPRGELLTNARMAALFEAALKSAAAGGRSVADPWGERVQLERLPQSLLERLDPRVMVSDGTRLPEDIVSWTRWVSEEAS